MKIKLLLADENKLFRALLTERFLTTLDIEVVAEAGNCKEILEKVSLINPDIVLTEIDSPNLNGIEITKFLQKKMPTVKVVALTNSFEKDIIKCMLEAKAWGYLMKNESFEQIRDNLRKIHSGKKLLSPDVQNLLIDEFIESKGSKIVNPLTKRESEILKLLAEGKSIREISETFFISIKTTGTHKQNIFEKMGFSNLTQLVRYALKDGIIS